MEYNLVAFANYFQIYIEDSLYTAFHIPTFDEEEMSFLLSVGKGSLCIFTIRDMKVPLLVKIVDERPDSNFDEYDQLVEASIDISSGILSIPDVMDYTDFLFQVRIPVGIYQVLIGYQGLNTITENRRKGDESYTIFLWKSGITTEKKILKEWKSVPS
ncbi:hypothetical protein QNI16_31285 [Cytophagaceae bacterium YF14B1]|uniref:Uncharacterized protein n=1 Tax=Xanthocytophaga flava TaxID=3048013 RepID=A0AAE3QX47_9BACT|nr:hypothetical protein [Xanthocytophaga flavus]MDJ1485023.1 hypothetical protein [Xanthocytophaga flavus]